MASFKEYWDQMEFVEQVLNEFDGAPSAQAATTQTVGTASTKKWSATKDEILQMWRNLRGDIPIIITPLSDQPNPTGSNSTYGEDGIRVTGSWYFISSVLSRLKELVAYENPQTKLRLVFRGVDKDRGAAPDRQTFVFYLNAEKRKQGKAGRPSTNPTNKTPQIPMPGQ